MREGLGRWRGAQARKRSEEGSGEHGEGGETVDERGYHIIHMIHTIPYGTCRREPSILAPSNWLISYTAASPQHQKNIGMQEEEKS